MGLGQTRGKVGDRGGIGDVGLDAGHAGVVGNGLIRQRLAAAGQDQPVALGVQALGEAKADTRGGTGDEDGLRCGGHVRDFTRKLKENVVAGDADDGECGKYGKNERYRKKWEE